MTRQTTTHTTSANSAPTHTTSNLTRTLLAGGVAAGSLFIVVAMVQAFTRPGFDVQRDPLSLLSLGHLGWIQITNFIGSGLLFTTLAIGVRHALDTAPARTWGPLLLGGFGVGIIIAGVFRTDPALGFPPGTPAGTPAALSWHGWLHTIGFAVSFISLSGACFVFARRFRALDNQRWATCSTATGVITPVLIAIGMTIPAAAGLAFAAAGALASWWVAAIAVKLIADST